MSSMPGSPGAAQAQAQPLLEDFKGLAAGVSGQILNGSSSAKAIDYTLKRWAALTIT